MDKIFIDYELPFHPYSQAVGQMTDPKEQCAAIAICAFGFMDNAEKGETTKIYEHQFDLYEKIYSVIWNQLMEKKRIESIETADRFIQIARLAYQTKDKNLNI